MDFWDIIKLIYLFWGVVGVIALLATIHGRKKDGIY